MGPTGPKLSRGSGGRDFVFWPEENGGKRPEVDLGAVAKTLVAGEERALPEGLVEAMKGLEKGELGTTIYPATLEWRRTTGRTMSNDEEWWWEAVAPGRDASTAVPSPFEVKPARAEAPMTPDEIWEMAARELADAPVVPAKAQSPVDWSAATAPPATNHPTVEAKPIAAETVAAELFARGAALDGPSRRAFTIRRSILLLLVGAGVVAFFYRAELSAIDWRGLWGNAMRRAGLSGLDSKGPARKAVPVPEQLRSRSSANSRGHHRIESPTRPSGTDATPVPTDPGAPKADFPSVFGPAMPATEADTPAPSPPAAVEAAASRDGSSALESGDEPPPALEPSVRRQSSSSSKTQLSASDQTQAAEAQTAVENLITAESIEKVLPWIFDPGNLASTVREYHVSHPLKGLNQAVVELEHAGTIPLSGTKAFIFNVIHSDHPRGFPVSAEHTPEGYRIDWQSYIQWRNESLRRFVEQKSLEAQTLFVVLRRAHYFNDDVPRLDEKLCFKISSVVPGDEGTFAFVDHPSALAQSLTSTYAWRKLYFPVVEVQWIREPHGAPYVRLNRIVRSTWRRMGDKPPA